MAVTPGKRCGDTNKIPHSRLSSVQGPSRCRIWTYFSRRLLCGRIALVTGRDESAIKLEFCLRRRFFKHKGNLCIFNSPERDSNIAYSNPMVFRCSIFYSGPVHECCNFAKCRLNRCDYLTRVIATLGVPTFDKSLVLSGVDAIQRYTVFGRGLDVFLGQQAGPCGLTGRELPATVALATHELGQ